MNREIKFRGKQIGTNTWIYGSFISYPDRSTYIAEYGSTIDELLSRCVHYNTVGQYTGLKDKNGKEIYEGDILIFGKNDTKYKVVWYNDGWLAISKEGDEYGAYTRNIYHNNLYAEKNYYIEIIGNVHENIEML